MRHMYTLLLVQILSWLCQYELLTSGIEFWSELLLVKAAGPSDQLSKFFRDLRWVRKNFPVKWNSPVSLRLAFAAYSKFGVRK